MSSNDFLVVGIGASAGGVNACRSFFEQVPADSGMAFVTILHLSPEYDSHLSEVLQRSSKIPVTTVQDRVRVEPNHVYVVSPRQSLTMDDGWLVQSPATRVEERRAPIDIFFRTLAEARGDRAVCIVLSGTGADGSMGLKRIKERGGTCLVQDPAEAEHDDMPRNAVGTTLADDVLPVAAMPGRLIAFRDRMQTVRLPEAPQDRDAPDERALHQVFNELRVRTGHDFSNYKRGTVLRRVERRLGVRQFPDLATYAEFIREHPEEAQSLLKDLLISVTQFFRDDAAFKALAQQVIPKLFEGKSAKDQVRVWVPGCATGEEAYALAMLLSEHAATISEAPTAQIFATDIDEQAVARAREGRYRINDAVDVSPERLQRFFSKEGEFYRVRKDLRETVLFAHHNLLKDPPFSHLDLVSCRNLLIYLNHTAQEQVMEVLHFALNPNGYLFVGSSESMEGSSDLFAAVNKDAHIYQSRGGPMRLGLQVAPLTYSRGMPRLHAPEPPQEARARERLIPPDLHQRLLEEYAPPSIIVTDEYEIVHVSERASRMLEFPGGEPSHNLFRVVRPELRIELRAALHQAAQHRTNVQISGLRVRFDDGRLLTVNVTVRPVLRDADPARGFFLVLFEEAGEAPVQDEPPTMVVSTNESAQHLEDELVRVKSQLRNTIEQYETQAEELKASNEELQAINEELRSATEELETSKEELESVNEELRTVNQELKVKIDEHAQAANDIQNLINSTDFGTVFLDRSGRIKLFTPRARDIFRLIPSDRGRPLQDISSHLEEPDLSKDVERVLDRLERVEREVFTRDGRWQLMRIAPYRTSEDRIDGVVLTFVDVTERKLAAVQLTESERRLRRALEVDTVGVLFIGTGGLVTRTNEAFFRLSGLSREDLAAGNLRWEDLAAPEKRADFVSALEELRGSGRLVPYELECRRPGGAPWWALVTGTRLSEAEAVIFLVDITDRHKAVEELEEDDRRKNEFLAALAHELRNPLAPIAAGLEVLRLSGTVDGRATRAREVMERQVQHMIRLVEDLLEVSRITLGKIELRREPSDLAPILRTAIEACAPTFRAGQQTVTVDITPDPLPMYGDSVRLVQVFTNLLRNAAKYTPEDGSIAINVAREGAQAVVSVKDTGMGIPPKMLPRIFDLFTQGPLLPDGQFQTGLGIGLTLVRTLVEAHGGQVAAASEGVGTGATFTVKLPLMPVQQVVPKPEASPSVDLSGHRIVVVDDNHDAADSLGTLLTMLEAEVHVTYTGRDALAMIAEHHPSIVFVDLGMPGMDGFEVAREARHRHPGEAMTLVALTGWGQQQAKQAVADAGFDHHVTKPASMERLTEILSSSVPAGADPAAADAP